MPRVSNRRYPPRKCKNASCGSSFEPHDRRQEYCDPQCRMNANNDKRIADNSTRFNDERQARLNHKILESIWKKLTGQKEKLVGKTILEWERFKFDSQALIRKNSKSGGNILWYYDYGLELVDPSQKIFEIHKKT